jgi:hypothetical protein
MLVYMKKETVMKKRLNFLFWKQHIIEDLNKLLFIIIKRLVKSPYKQ